MYHARGGQRNSERGLSNLNIDVGVGWEVALLKESGV